jgi:hypothetical protein
VKILRWIFGFPLAAAISLGILFLAIQYGLRGFYSSQLFIALYIYRLAIIFFCFALWIFLTCLFIPSNKKLAGLMPMAASTLFLIIVLYMSIKNISDLHFNQNSIIGFSSFYIGMLMGYFMSYVVFKNKGWNRLKKELKTREFDI